MARSRTIPARRIATAIGAEGSDNTMGKTVEERFWSKVDRRGDNECWEWQAAKRPNSANTPPRGVFVRSGTRTEYAHRVAYAFYYGVEPGPRTVVCHTCDNPLCCNPNHLMLSSQKANLQDAARKGRMPGSGPRRSDETVRTAHRLAMSGLSHGEIAKTIGELHVTVRTWLAGTRRRDIYEEFHGAVAA